MSEQETFADIIAEMRKRKYGDEECEVKWCLTPWADRLDAAHKREIDALKQRCAELNAEVAAKDEVIQRLNDAISEWQRRKMATPENSSAVGDVAKLREALEELVANIEMRSSTFGLNVMVDTKTFLDAKAALAATSNQNTQVAKKIQGGN